MDLTVMERVGDRKKLEGYCSTGQSPQWAVVPVEEEEEEDRLPPGTHCHRVPTHLQLINIIIIIIMSLRIPIGSR
jgi:hypothetical protein